MPDIRRTLDDLDATRGEIEPDDYRQRLGALEHPTGAACAKRRCTTADETVHLCLIQSTVRAFALLSQPHNSVFRRANTPCQGKNKQLDGQIRLIVWMLLFLSWTFLRPRQDSNLRPAV